MSGGSATDKQRLAVKPPDPSVQVADPAVRGEGDVVADLLIVVLNYRTPDLTIQCLASLEPEVRSVPQTRVVVVDNNSGDGSVAQIRQVVHARGWTAWTRVLPLPHNGGFAWGNNRGIEAGWPARHVLLLNSDTIVHPGCLAHCMGVMDGDASIGAMSCRLLNPDGSIQNTARRFPTPLRLSVAATGLPWYLPRLFGWAQIEYENWNPARDRRDPGWVAGAFLLVRADLMARLGGLDEEFFFYGEDIDFCHRVWRSGLRCHYDPAVSITHLGGCSSDPTRMDQSARSRHHWRGRYLVQRKCYGLLAAAWVRVVDVVACAARVLWLRLRRRRSDPRYQDLRCSLAMILRSLEPVPQRRKGVDRCGV